MLAVVQDMGVECVDSNPHMIAMDMNGMKDDMVAKDLI